MLQDKHRKNEKSLEKLLSTFNLDNAIRAMDRILDKRKSAIKLSNNHFQDGIFLELTGLYQVENGFTILTALDELVKMGYHISPKNYFEGFSNVCELTGLMGRMAESVQLSGYHLRHRTQCRRNQVYLQAARSYPGQTTEKRSISYSVWSMTKISAVY